MTSIGRRITLLGNEKGWSSHVMSRTPTVAPSLLTGANPSVSRGGDIGEEFQSAPRSAIEFSR